MTEVTPDSPVEPDPEPPNQPDPELEQYDGPWPHPRHLRRPWSPLYRNPSQQEPPLQTLLTTYQRGWQLYKRLEDTNRKIQFWILALSAFTSGGLLVLISNGLPTVAAYIGSGVSFIVACLTGYHKIYRIDERMRSVLETNREVTAMLGEVRGAPDEVDRREFWRKLKNAEGKYHAE